LEDSGEQEKKRRPWRREIHPVRSETSGTCYSSSHKSSFTPTTTLTSLSAGEEETAYALVLSLKIVSLDDIDLRFDQQAPACYPHLLMSQAPSRCRFLQAHAPLVQQAGADRRTLATDEESTTPLLDDNVDLCFGHQQLTAGTSLKRASPSTSTCSTMLTFVIADQ